MAAPGCQLLDVYLFANELHDDGPGPPGAVKRPLAFPIVNRVYMRLLYGRVGHLTAKNGDSWPGQGRRRWRRGCA
jgi:hypothetical protein